MTQVFETASFFDDTVWPSERPFKAHEGDGRQDERTRQNPGRARPTEGPRGKDDEQEEEEILEVDEVSTERRRWTSRPQLDDLTQHSSSRYHINRHVPCYFPLTAQRRKICVGGESSAEAVHPRAFGGIELRKQVRAMKHPRQ